MKAFEAKGPVPAGPPTPTHDAPQGADRIELHHYGAGHTNGDTIVVFPCASVAAHRRFSPGQRRLHRRGNGGSGVAYPETLAKAAKASRASTRSFPVTRRRRPPGRRSWNSASSTLRSWRRCGRPGRWQDGRRGRRGAHASRRVQGLRDAERKGQRREVYAELKLAKDLRTCRLLADDQHMERTMVFVALAH